MTDATTTETLAASEPPASEPPAPEAAPAAEPPAPEVPAPGPAAAPPVRSRAWVGVLVVGVLVAALVGANVVLFRRVQAAQDAADRAAAVVAAQADLAARLDAVDTRLTGVDSAQGDTADQAGTTARDVARLRACVNEAIDGMAKSISSGKATTVTKC